MFSFSRSHFVIGSIKIWSRFHTKMDDVNVEYLKMNIREKCIQVYI